MMMMMVMMVMMMMMMDVVSGEWSWYLVVIVCEDDEFSVCS